MTWYGSDGKESFYNAGDPGSIPGSGRSPGEGNGNPLQYSCLENPTKEEPSGLHPMGFQRVGHNLATNTQTLLIGLNKFTYILFHFNKIVSISIIFRVLRKYLPDT